ncbi:hypothetical protein AMK68_00165 [candidate division KD3-62 bacterium DG_56]|uniref:Phage tail tape measure protein domain-containing protein n=1 Tax=candidate division KD3-62 bacterium DG_56 TaxID=1704032 RepID=A0A0S7XQW3_9BACT|nr:MAG: hypothetical protein AMK68_00165 [candidate division KD3-62 bacterium DG_56]
MATKLELIISAVDKASGALGAIDKKAEGLGGKFAKMGKMAGVGLAAVGTAAVAVGVGLFKIGADFDKAYDKIIVGTGATGEALEGLKDDFRAVFKGVPTDMESASTAISDLNTRLGLTGKPLQQLSKQMLEMSRMTKTDLAQNIEEVTRVFGDWGVTAADQSLALDKLFRTTQATNVPIAELGRMMVQYGAPMRQLGFTFDQGAAMIAKFQKEGVNTELVMGSMRIALGKMARDGEPAIETFGRVTDQIKNAGSASEANKLALELFGARAGPDMAAAIREGRFAIDELVAGLEGSEGAILDTARQTESLSQKFTRFKNRVLVGIEPLAMGIFDGLAKLADLMERKLGPAVRWVSDAVSGFLVGFKRFNDPDVTSKGPFGFGEKLFVIFRTKVYPVLQDVADILKTKVIPAIKAIVPHIIEWYAIQWKVAKIVLPMLLDALDTLYDAFMLLYGNMLKPVVIPILEKIGKFLLDHKPLLMAVATAILLLTNPWLAVAAAIVLVLAKWDEISAFFIGIGEAISDFVDGVIETIEELPIIGKIFDALRQVVKDKIEAIISYLRGLVDFARELIGFFKHIFKGEWGAAWDSLKQMAKIALGLFLDWLELTFVGTLRSIFTGLGLWDWAKGAFQTFKTEASGFLNGVVDTVRGLGGDIAKALGDGLRAAKGYITGALNAILTAIERGANFLIQGINKLSSPLRTLGGAVSDVLGFFGAPRIPSIPELPKISVPRLQEGGEVLQSGMAVVHRGERFSGVGPGALPATVEAHVHIHTPFNLISPHDQKRAATLIAELLRGELR